MHQMILLFVGVLVTVIGALPFGLVNLSVVDISLKQSRKLAMQIAHGAALVEVLYGVVAILAGAIISEFIQKNLFLNYSLIGILVIGSIVFILRKKEKNTKRFSVFSSFLKGVFLNLISFQVFLYWSIATAFLYARNILDTRFLSIMIFAVGIWLGKILVLWIYAFLSTRIISKSVIISKHLNRIIGGILMIIAVYQFFSL